MLTDLYLLQTYFEEPSSFAYGGDLVEKYGTARFAEAVAAGLLEVRRLPCAGGEGGRFVCRLTEAGAAAAALPEEKSGLYF